MFLRGLAHHRQEDGSTVGLSLSPIVAVLVIEDCTENSLRGSENSFNFKPVILKIFVDDGLAVLPKDQIDDFIATFNNYDKNLKFTIEEENGPLPFLDSLPITDNGTLFIDWYQKPTQSDTYSNSNSHNPMAQKKATVYNLANRGIRKSHPKFHAKNLMKIRDLLLENDYPLKFIASNETKVIIPYYKNFSENIKRMLSKRYIHTIFKCNNKFNSIIRLGKDNLKEMNQTDVGYKINCLHCPKSYIGQTMRYLKRRVEDHRNNIISRIREPNFLSLHKMAENGHDFDWKTPQILDVEPHLNKRLISEMFHIQLNENNINVREDTRKLNGFS
ncbi:hypothetical protein QAD02_003774 [Eretmocerus hayati]|uniref:Uncharacterized protein n=1 Tax=Eretmocerus hayati TaxID=131215 RepID=A0ACC2NMX1_9HYME|nr:hypothetical protein QAD02_003774 [Eretmocerus hayati]